MSLKTSDPRRFSHAKEDVDFKMDTVFSNFKALQSMVFENTADGGSEQAQSEGKVYFRTDLDPPEARVKLNGRVYRFTLTPV